MDLIQALKTHFGFNTFRPYQEEIIRQVLSGEDCLAVLPTGSGKSLCYQLPAVMSEGTALIVSPLIALMEDQVQQLDKLGISSAALNSMMPGREQQWVLDHLDRFTCIYVSPERLMDPMFLSHLKGKKISFLVIDEAHCISQWGHAFRKEYRQLGCLRQEFPHVPLVALTATATKDVREDIMHQLSIPPEKLILGSFERENLTIRVYPRHQGRDQLLKIVKKYEKESGIVYAATRKQVDKLHEFLTKKGFNVNKYHAGLSDNDRAVAQRQFINDDVPIMVATIAFGMGINKPNIRYVCHYEMPKSIENYYQEIGRAGRDGLPAECIMLYSMADMVIQKKLMSELVDKAVSHQQKRKTEQMLSYCNSATCRCNELLSYFGEHYDKQTCQRCDNCLDTIEWIDGTTISQMIVSCVYRLQERFGLQYVCDVLVGSESQKIKQYRHNALSTYGLLSDYSKKDVQFFIYSLINLGYLDISGGEYPVVKITRKAYPIRDISGIKFKKQIEQKPSKKKRKGDTVGVGNPDLFEVLRSFRKELAKQQGIPPFMVFHDATLKELSSIHPKTYDELLDINGIGPKKLELYGEEILKVLNR